MFWKRQRPQQIEFLSPAEIKSHIRDLQLPQIITDFFEGNCQDERAVRLLGNQYQAPHCLLDMPLEHATKHYRVERYIPLLAIWQDVILAYDHIGKGFVRYSMERFREQNLLLMTWDGLWLNEVIGWWEVEKGDDDILYLGKLFGLKHTKMIIEEAAKSNMATYAQCETWRLSLLQQMDGLIKFD